MKESITVITPTYNRLHTLENCYNSLITQTNQSFIWLIIDDGSTDNTEKKIEQWKNENLIKIQYIKKSNGGKASALNVAFDNLITKYWVCLDSDDYFSYDAIEKALVLLEKIKNISHLCGVIALRNHPNGEVMGGKRIPVNVKETTTLELRNKYNIKSEYIQFYKTNITKSYRFPEINGEKFITPEYLANMLNEKYDFLVSQSTFCYCEYLDDGLTKNKVNVIKKNPKGYTLIMANRFKNSKGFKSKSIWCIKYISGVFLNKNNFRNALHDSPNQIMTILYYPLGWLVYKLRFSK